MDAVRWSVPIDKLIQKALGNIETVARKSHFEAGRRIAMKTPVKTGAARGSWQSGIGRPNRSQSDNLDPSGGGVVAELASSVATWKPLSGQSAFWTNTKPYILRLENGSSDQAPNGMMKTTMQEMGGVIQDVARGA